MKVMIILILFILLVFLANCSKEVVSLNNYEKVILENAFYKSFPLLQSKAESETLKKNQIKSLSMVIYMNDSEPNSVTFIEYDTEGRFLYRTTIEESGCYSLYWIKQEFIYENNKLKKVNSYTFKYQTNSIFEKWMIKDTSSLILFDWADYSYNGDTTTIESGWAIWKFIKDEDGKIIKHIDSLKANNQLIDYDYVYTNKVITAKVMGLLPEPVTSTLEIDKNIVLKNFKTGEKKSLEEYVYDSNGLLITRIHYLNGDTTSKAVFSYSYY